MQFDAFLRERLANGGFTTADAVATFLPLARQTVAAHAEGKVAPLEGLSALQVEGVQIWFAEAELRPPRLDRDRVRQLEETDTKSIEVVDERRLTTTVGAGEARVENLTVGRRDEELKHPVYLPGYVSWEHVVGHHDPLTDVFSLGLILASLACGLDLCDEADLNAFVGAHRNLFGLNPDLHPVLARAIVRMTELNRHRRPQDVASLLKSIENYREQEVDFEVELSREADFSKKDPLGKRQVLLAKLRQRLFEISRRNRLLHFRPTMQSVNLTQASVPLSFDVRSIRPEQILTWNETLHRDAVKEEPIPLNRFLNFREAVYLPSVLDRIRTEAERDQKEFGFAQLRLVACFLRWANLKESPPELFDSPFVLLPVELTKRKGVRDTYWLKTLDSVAEINPVVRHLLQELYDIALPETIDLEKTTLDELHRSLSESIAASEPAVNLQKIDRPRIDVIHDKARRRLDQYCRHVRLSGRSIHNFMDLEYSYDPANYHPLGLTLYSSKVRPARTHLQAIIDSRPQVRQYAVAPAEEAAGESVVEKEQSLFQLREGGDGNPYAWEFDLCNVTIGNFKYRKMSLVQDFTALLGETPANPGFDATFALAPKSIEARPVASLAPADRFHVVSCDPTQISAIAEARTGTSYIIQGPPGTGKSQTIANLIADYVVRGKRVLFVCEKRAAIDVVYHRLRQKGLDPLCCLIHDSQADKRQFVLDLKQTYELFLAEADTPAGRAEKERQKLLQTLEQELQPLDRFNAAMQGTPPASGIPLHRLLHRAVELKHFAPASSASPRDHERVIRFAAWEGCRDALDHFHEALQPLQKEGVLARHSLRLVHTRVKDEDRPIEYVASCISTASRLIGELLDAFAESEVPEELWNSIAHARELIARAAAAEFLARCGLGQLLNPKSDVAKTFQKQIGKLADLDRARYLKQLANGGWKQKLPPQESATALAQARLFERDPLRFIKPGWWRLRGVLRRAYDFRSHQIVPGWVEVLQRLDEEHQAAAALQEAEAGLCREYGIDGSLSEFRNRLHELIEGAGALPESARVAQEYLQKSTDPDRTIQSLAAIGPQLDALIRELDRFLTAYEGLSLSELKETIEEVGDSVDELPDFLDCLRPLAELPPDVAAALRTIPWTLGEFEAAAAARSLDEILRADRPLDQFDAARYRRQVAKLDKLSGQWLEINARLVCERVRERFLEHVKISSLPAAQLTAEQKELKKQYARGRRDLEHEFGKTMRYKPIRDIVASDSGVVVRDLKPVWLMSPLSVSDTLPLDTQLFDVVIFDEASQIPLEESVPSLFRATQAIVVGDEMQLPPTNFFSARHGEEEDQLRFEEEGETVEYDLQSSSLLNHAARNLPSRMLGWHYRSRSESLISFSNWAFYQAKLLTVPEQQLPPRNRPALVSNAAGDAASLIADALDRPVSFHFMSQGVYENRRNRAEAEYIAELVRGLLQRENRPTVGIVAFSEAQQGEIESALERLAQEDRPFGEQLEQEFEREEDDQFAGLLVKNLENIQGDERDVIIMSVCYGPGPDGRMRMNFGPINQSGGEKRLNVAFSRAKRHMMLVSSIHSEQITNDYNDGANCLKSYLQYAEACSAGETSTAERVLRSMSLAATTSGRPESAENVVVAELGEALRKKGYEIEFLVGQSHFRCDLAVRRNGDAGHRLGILVDTESYYRQPDLLERDLMKPKLLQAFGWRVLVVLTKDWWESPESVVAQVTEQIEAAESPTNDDATDPAEESAGDEVASPGEVATAPVAIGRPISPTSAVKPAELQEPDADVAEEESASGWTRRFELVEGKSAKFWEITVRGGDQFVRFGRIGSRGQEQSNSFTEAAIAEKDALRQIKKKLAKGYEEKSGS